MATKTNSKKISASSKKYLKDIAEETFNSDLGYMFVDSRANVLVEQGYVVLDESITDDCGDVAAQITESGAMFLGIHPTQTGVAESIPEEETKMSDETTENKTAYEIEIDVPLAPVKRRGAGHVKYPFEELPVGGSFHIPSTEECPNPTKKIGSSVSAAKKRQPEREYTTRTVDESDPKGPGVRVYRLA